MNKKALCVCGVCHETRAAWGSFFLERVKFLYLTGCSFNFTKKTGEFIFLEKPGCVCVALIL